MFKKFYRYFHHYLIPHEKNNYKAKSLHNSTLLLYVIFLVVFQLTTSSVRMGMSNVLGYATDINTERVLLLVNQKRQEAGLGQLKLNDQLSSAANNKASDMFTKNYWAHISPTGTTPWYFISLAGYEYVYAGENLARSFNTADEVVTAWMNSPTHRDNIMKAEYADIGLAVLNGRLNGEDTTLVVQEFGTKANDLAQMRKEQEEKKSLAQNNPPRSENSHVQQAVAGVNQPAAKQTLIASQQKVVFLPFAFTKSVSMFLAEFLLIILLFDSIYIWKHKIFRISGHNLAHIIFLAALLGAMGATGIGVIL